jgi:peptide/nickel transport system permease protein
MGNRFIRLLLNGVGVIIGVATILFFLFDLLPADPARMLLGQRSDSASVAIIRRDLGTDLPTGIRFLKYMNDLSPVSVYSDDSTAAFRSDLTGHSHILLLRSGDWRTVLKFPYLRRSYQSKRDVAGLLAERLPDTAVLAISAMLIAVLLGIILGVLAALFKDSWIDRLCMLFSVLFVSIPSFFAAILFAWLFGYLLAAWTGLDMTGGWKAIDPFKGEYIAWKNLLLPAVVLGLRPLSIIVQLTRSSLLEVLSMDFIRTARAKGLRSRTVLLRHALRNALNPVITAVSGWLGSLLAGAVFVEYIFGWNGIGKLVVQALDNYDLPVVMGVVLFISFVFILLNMLADLINLRLDPRIRTTG